MGYTERLQFNPKEKRTMVKRTYPTKKVEWLELSEWELVKELEIVALIFEEGEREGTGTFYKTTIKLSVDPKAPELYFKMSERRQTVDPQTNHVRVFSAPIIKDVSTGRSTFAVISPFLARNDYNVSSAPQTIFTNIEASDAVKISKKEASEILETKLGCCGVYRDFKLRERLY